MEFCKCLNRKYYFQFRELVNKYGEITNYQELDAAMVFFERFIFQEVLDVAANIKGLDYLINGEQEDNVLYLSKNNKKHFFSPQSLIVARLAGNPNFEDLVLLRESENWGLNEDVRETQWPKLLKYLREEVKPIV